MNTYNVSGRIVMLVEADTEADALRSFATRVNRIDADVLEYDEPFESEPLS